MLALICFVLAILASPFKSKSRLEAENAALRHQLIVLRRKVHGRVKSRTHLSLNKDALLRRAVQRSGAVIAIPVLGGLHHRYARI